MENVCWLVFWLVSVFVCYMFELSFAVCLTIDVIRSEVNLMAYWAARIIMFVGSVVQFIELLTLMT